MSLKKILVIGAGPAGSSIARKFAEKNFHVEIFDERFHVAGNCYDKVNDHGHLIHYYGPHYFRTNSDELLNWLTRFTDWISGDYFVNAKVQQKEVPLPISLATISQLKNKEMTKDDFEAYLKEQRVPFDKVTNAEEQCLSLVGRELYELFFKNYTIKQWGVHPRNLEAYVTARIPLRFDHDIRYPSEKHQVLPKDGYTKMFQNILNHPNIHLQLNTRLPAEKIIANRGRYHAIFYTGAIDSFFNFCFGRLQYRSLRFEWVHHPHLDYFQKTVQCNYPNEQEYTRVVESKHITKIQGIGTTLCYEYPSSLGEPFYPMPIKLQLEKYHQYKLLSQNESAKKHPIYFIGRLAEYKYYNMDHIFLHALHTAEEVINKV
jgi:UDP-galactopyranose mutase